MACATEEEWRAPIKREYERLRASLDWPAALFVRPGSSDDDVTARLHALGPGDSAPDIVLRSPLLARVLSVRGHPRMTFLNMLFLTQEMHVTPACTVGDEQDEDESLACDAGTPAPACTCAPCVAYNATVAHSDVTACISALCEDSDSNQHSHILQAVIPADMHLHACLCPGHCSCPLLCDCARAGMCPDTLLYLKGHAMRTRTGMRSLAVTHAYLVRAAAIPASLHRIIACVRASHTCTVAAARALCTTPDALVRVAGMDGVPNAVTASMCAHMRASMYARVRRSVGARVPPRVRLMIDSTSARITPTPHIITTDDADVYSSIMLEYVDATCTRDGARVRSYMTTRKLPQICVLLDLLQPHLTGTVHVWDVGGACGYTALALASMCASVQVHVMDVNAAALERGQALAAAFPATVSNRVHWHALDVLHVLQTWPSGELRSSLPQPHALIALHACGGVTDAVLALSHVVAVPVTIVVPCCYGKHVALRCDAWAATTPAGDWTRALHKDMDAHTLLRACDTVFSDGGAAGDSVSDRACAIVNTARIHACLAIAAAPMHARLLRMDAAYTSKNQVIVLQQATVGVLERLGELPSTRAGRSAQGVERVQTTS